MNSRDAAYDEEEQLRRAIEASKEDTIPEQGEGGTGRAKRGRSDSEEYEPSIMTNRSVAINIYVGNKKAQSDKERARDQPLR